MSFDSMSSISQWSLVAKRALALWATRLCLIGLGVAAWTAPAARAEGSSENGSILRDFVNWISDDVFDGRGISISTDGLGRTTASWSDGHDKLKVRMDGDVEFGDDDATISRIAKGGYISIWELRGSVKTALEVGPGRDGTLEYDYQVNGKETAFDESGRVWLARVLVDIVRKTGINAEARANRILDREGVDGLLKEVQFVPSDYVMRIFLTEALARPDLTTADCSSILDEAAIAMDSDYEKAELLLSVAKHRSWNSSLTTDYVGVAVTMESDYEIRRALSTIDLNDQTGQDVITAILQVAAKMESDYETTELLVTLAPRCRGSQQLVKMYVDAAAGIDSDYEARRALTALDWEDGASSEAVIAALRLAGRLESDYEAAELLTKLAPNCQTDERTVSEYISAVHQIESDYEAARALSSLCAADHFTEPSVLALIEAVGAISSSYEQSNVLRAVGRHCHDNGTLEDAYVDALEAVDADYERDKLYTEFYRGDREARRARRSN